MDVANLRITFLSAEFYRVSTAGAIRSKRFENTLLRRRIRRRISFEVPRESNGLSPNFVFTIITRRCLPIFARVSPIAFLRDWVASCDVLNYVLAQPYVWSPRNEKNYPYRVLKTLDLLSRDSVVLFSTVVNTATVYKTDDPGEAF